LPSFSRNTIHQTFRFQNAGQPFNPFRIADLVKILQGYAIRMAQRNTLRLTLAKVTGDEQIGLLVYGNTPCRTGFGAHSAGGAFFLVKHQGGPIVSAPDGFGRAGLKAIGLFALLANQGQGKDQSTFLSTDYANRRSFWIALPEMIK
jgi:hypothetical protein